MDNKQKPINREDRPIVAKGKYNMDFIDWNNEWSQVYNK